MELFVSALKSLAMLPVFALLEVPFIRISASIVLSRRLSFGASYLMALIAGSALLAANVVLWPVYAQLSKPAEAALTFSMTLALAGWLYGYFLTNAEGRSVGMLKGILVVLLSSALFGIVLLALAFVVIGSAKFWGG